MSAIQAVSQEKSFAERVVAFAAVMGLSLQQFLFAFNWLSTGRRDNT